MRRGSFVGKNAGTLIDDVCPSTPFTISTPYRLLRTPLTKVGETPFAVKYPLLYYLDLTLGNKDLEIKLEAQKITSHAAQQSVIAKVCLNCMLFFQIDALLNMCLLAPKQQQTLIDELKRQYILAVLTNHDDGEAIFRTIARLIHTPRNSAEFLESTGPVLSLKDQENTPRPSPSLSTAPASADSTCLTLKGVNVGENTSRTPINTTTPANPTPVGQTPLNVLKRHHVTRLRVSKLNQKIADEPEHVQVAIRKRLSCIAEEDDEMALADPMTHVVYSTRPDRQIDTATPSKKIRTDNVGTDDPSPQNSEISSAQSQPFSVTVTIGLSPDTANRNGRPNPSPDLPLALRRPKRECAQGIRFSSSGIITIDRRQNQNNLPNLLSIVAETQEPDPLSPDKNTSCPVQEKTYGDMAEMPPVSTELSQQAVSENAIYPLDKIKVSRRNSVASMFTTRGVPQQGNKFQSRMSLTAKLKQTREKRQARRQQMDQIHPNHDAVTQQNHRQRKCEQFAAMEKTKFISTYDISILEDLQHTMQSVERSSLSEIIRNRDHIDWHHLLREIYKFDDFHSFQIESLEHLSSSNAPLFLCVPTGSGKSLVFFLSGALSIIQDGGLCVMVLPTKSLVTDQFESAKAKLSSFFNIVKLHGSLEAGEFATVLKAMSKGLVDFLLTTPEQFTSQSLIAAIKQAGRPISLLCIDEAHCLSEWSHSFRPAYQSVLEVQDHHYTNAKLLLMTATVTLDTKKSILDYTLKKGKSNNGQPDAVKVVSLPDSYWRDDLRVQVAQKDTNAALLDIEASIRQIKRSQSNKPSTLLVFVWMKHQAEQVAKSLRERGITGQICFYHSSISESEKSRINEQLVNGNIDVLVSTQALGLGLDVPHISTVYHLSIPSSIEQWLQEMGRCNRDKRFQSVVCYGYSNFQEYWKRRQKTAASVVDNVAIPNFFQNIFAATSPSITCVANSKELRYMLNSKAHKSEIFRWADETTNLGFSVTTVDDETVRRMLNCASDDELQVISAIAERTALKHTCQAGQRLIGWWLLSDLEFRCFDRDIDDLGEQGGIITELRKTIWRDKANQGVFRLRWAEILMSQTVDDPLSLRSDLYQASHENKISVRPISGTRRLYVVKSSADQSDFGGLLTRMVLEAMQTNNQEQLRKQEMVRIAWKLAAECDENELHRFLKLYFDGKMEWPVKNEKLKSWLYEGVDL